MPLALRFGLLLILWSTCWAGRCLAQALPYERIGSERGEATTYALDPAMPGRLPQPGDLVALRIPGDGVLAGTVDFVEEGLEGVHVVVGHVGDDPWRRFFLSIGADGVAGSIAAEGGDYVLGGPRTGFTLTRQDPASLVRTAAEPGQDDGARPEMVDAPRLLDSPQRAAQLGDAVIEFAAVGNPEFIVFANAHGGLYAYLEMLTAKANAAFRDSGIRLRLKLVRFESWSGSNTADDATILNLITPAVSPDPAAGAWFRNLHDSTQADIVVFFRTFKQPRTKCGRGWISGYRDAAGQPLLDVAGYREFGYATVSVGEDGIRGCSDYTLAHEIGHNLGSMHDHLTDSGDARGAYDESFGHYVEAGTRIVTTIMGYEPEANASPARVFSNPLLTKPCLGVPCGVASGAGAADNARRMNDVRFKVGSWRGPRYAVLRATTAGEGEGTITVQGEACGTGCEGGYLYGSDARLAARPGADSAFAGWSGACTGTGDCTVVMSSDLREVTANFTATVLKFRLTVSRAGQGSGRVTSMGIDCGDACTARYLPGTSLVLQAIADPGFEFAGWEGACAGQPATCRLLMDAAKATTARFKGRRVTMVSARFGTSYAIRSDGSLWAWGNNDAGQFGTGNKGSVYTPVLVATGFQSIEAGVNCAYGIKRDGSLWAWGSNEGGKLGDGSGVEQLRPVKVGDGFLMVSAGDEHAIALKTDGTAWAWGRNLYGQLGTGNQQVQPRPVKIAAGYATVSAQGSSSTGVTSAGALMSWGVNITGEVGDGSYVNRLSPVQIGSDFTRVYRGFNRGFAIKRDGSLWAWGQERNGELGTGNFAGTTLRPVQVGEKFRFAAPQAAVSSAALKDDLSLWAWGWNYQRAAFGDPGQPEYRPVPTRIGGHFILLAAHASSTYLAVRDDGSLWAWGTNENGEVGDGTRDAVPRPKLVLSVD